LLLAGKSYLQIYRIIILFEMNIMPISSRKAGKQTGNKAGLQQENQKLKEFYYEYK